jgi:endonuclease/exonuclease/phosphatase family metal-dependent hydrolase
LLSVASYNIGGFNICKGEDGYSLDAQAAVLKRMNPDIICFQEVIKDAKGQGRFYPNEDRVAKMAELVGLKHMIFAKPPDDDLRWPPLHMRFGLSIISRWPLTDIVTYKFSHLTDNNPGYPRLLLTAVVHPDNGHPKFRIASVHLMHSIAGKNDRVIMTDFIRNKFENDSLPMILGGDYNAKDPSEEMRILLVDGDWTNATPDFGIDKILFRPSGHWTVVETEEIASPASDHNPIRATFKYPGLKK